MAPRKDSDPRNPGLIARLRAIVQRREGRHISDVEQAAKDLLKKRNGGAK